MKPFLTLTAALTLVVNALACGASQRAAAPSPSPSPTPGLVTGRLGDDESSNPQVRDALKNLLFADEPLEKHLEGVGRGGGVRADEEPWRSFALALSHSKQGRAGEAKKVLRGVLSMPVAEETRVSLWAWTALRALGERPPPGVADEVQGVICELHNEAGVGTLAAYADGRARWLPGSGAGFVWDAPGADKELDALSADLLKAAEPLVKRAPAAEKRKPTEVEMEHCRVTVLTFGGLHVIDAYGPDLDGKAGYLVPQFEAAGRLIEALTKKQPQKGQ
jgi:hypothetical protein